MYTLLLVLVAVTLLAFVLYAAKRLGVLAEDGKEETAPFSRLTWITGIAVFGLFFTLLDLFPVI